MHTAQDRRDMLQEIMRRGTSSLGTDVPSEREINRLAARNDEEFWLFEKMDEERRRRERYRSRLMEEHEVPEWAYSVSKGEKSKEKDIFSIEVSGKRRRKEVVYADTLSDTQWMKALEDGEDLSKLSIRGKKRGHLFDSIESSNDIMEDEDMLAGQKIENRSVASEDMSDDMLSSEVPRRSSSGIPLYSKDESEVDGEDNGEGNGSSWVGGSFSWKSHKRKRSYHGAK